jgi:hypothetical protein
MMRWEGVSRTRGLFNRGAIMARVIGTISDGDKVLAHGAVIDLRDTGTPGGSKSFAGTFVLPKNVVAPPAGHKYLLAVSDGRSGQVLVKRVRFSSNSPTNVEFVNAGKFE